MKRLYCTVLFIYILSTSGCAELVFNQTENAERGQTYDDYEEEQKKKKESWRLHQRDN